MEADAKLRMDVYQEGQRAFNARTPCPYTDWRAKTWEKGRAAAQAYEEKLRETVPCGVCGTPTRMTGTERCDRCWELESRIHSDPELARKILEAM